jgi:hypothetical protein
MYSRRKTLRIFISSLDYQRIIRQLNNVNISMKSTNILLNFTSQSLTNADLPSFDPIFALLDNSIQPEMTADHF